VLLNYPTACAVDTTAGILYVLDNDNYDVRSVKMSTGEVSLFAGNHETQGYQDGTGTQAQFTEMKFMVMDNARYLYVTDYVVSGIIIRKITPGGVVTTLFSVEANALAVDSAGYLYAYRSTDKDIVKLDSAGNVITTVLSNIEYYVYGMAVDSSGDIIFTYASSEVRKVTQSGVVISIAGNNNLGWVDDVGTNAMFQGPSGLALDTLGNIFVADSSNNDIRKISPTGVVTTWAGNTGDSQPPTTEPSLAPSTPSSAPSVPPSSAPSTGPSVPPSLAPSAPTPVPIAQGNEKEKEKTKGKESGKRSKLPMVAKKSKASQAPKEAGKAHEAKKRGVGGQAPKVKNHGAKAAKAVTKTPKGKKKEV